MFKLISKLTHLPRLTKSTNINQPSQSTTHPKSLLSHKLSYLSLVILFSLSLLLSFFSLLANQANATTNPTYN